MQYLSVTFVAAAIVRGAPRLLESRYSILYGVYQLPFRTLLVF